MSENKYTAADFANVEFATKNGLFAACRSRSGFWRTESGVALVDRDMAEEGWVPVPSSPATPTITESELRETIMGGSGFADAIRDGVTASLSRLGIEVVPDPVPTNAEQLTIGSLFSGYAGLDEAVEKDHSSVPGGWEHVAEFLDRAGVTAPGGEE